MRTSRLALSFILAFALVLSAARAENAAKPQAAPPEKKQADIEAEAEAEAEKKKADAEAEAKQKAEAQKKEAVKKAMIQRRVIIQAAPHGGAMVNGQIMMIGPGAPAGTPTANQPDPKPKAAPRPGEGDVLAFLNGDELHGKLLAVDPDKGVSWRHPDAAEPIRFRLGAVDEIGLEPPSAEKAFKYTAAVTLGSGDKLLGDARRLGPEGLILDTPYAGALTIRRQGLRSMSFNFTEDAAVVYSGPTSENDWKDIKQGNVGGGWEYRDGALYAAGRPGGIGRLIEFPQRARLDFDFAWRGYPQIQLYLLSKDLNPGTPSTYMINISNDYFHIQRRDAQGGHQQLGNFHNQGFAGKGKAHFTILMDRPKRSYYMLIDGRVAQQWTDMPGAVPNGKGLFFWSYSNMKMRLSNVRVTSWDGTVSTGRPEEVKATDKDVIVFFNDDKVTGTIEAIQDGKVSVQTDFARVDIPLPRVAEIHFKAPGGKPPRGKDLVAATLFGGGLLHLKVEKAEDGKLVGTSADFGDASLDLAAIQTIRFNLNAKRQKDDDDNDW